MKNFFWLFIPFFVLNSLQAQFNVSAVFDSTQMAIGDQTDLHLNVNQPSSSKVLYPTLSTETLGNFEIIEVDLKDSAIEVSNIQNHLSLEIRFYLI